MVATVEKPRRKTPGTRARRQSTRLTVADIRRVEKTVVQTPGAAEEFLRSIGATFDKDGNVVVTPL